MLVGAKVCDLAEDLLWFVCCLYVGILMPSLTRREFHLWIRTIIQVGIIIVFFLSECLSAAPDILHNLSLKGVSYWYSVNGIFIKDIGCCKKKVFSVE